MKQYVKCEFEYSDLLQQAIDLINEYYWREIDEDKDLTKSDDLSNIGIMFTSADETDDSYKELQVTVDLIHPSIKYYVDDTLVGEEKYKDLADLIDSDLSQELTFQDYYEACMSYGRDAGLLEN